ncbi:MAG: hypothetical protein IT285_06725 [Bdellovibrionales bacterium]|nr:hypothetical protein [Bdellovibrionales bacterium]
MRKFVEPTARNLLRKPLVMGVPATGLTAVAGASLGVFVLAGTNPVGNAAALGLGAAGYAGLRVLSRFAHAGWEETPLYWIERRLGRKLTDGTLRARPSDLIVSNPDTLTEADLIVFKDSIQERLLDLRPGQRWTLALRVDDRGARFHEIEASGTFDLRKAGDWMELARSVVGVEARAYSLHQLSVVTDPYWLFGILCKIPRPFTVLVSFQGCEAGAIKRRIELARRSNSRGDDVLANIDAEISFEEASLVLQGLSRGDDAVVEASLVVTAPGELSLDDSLFCPEKDQSLAVLSAIGVRRRFHRSHLVRIATACDLVPNVGDPREEGASILKTTRGASLYFSPQDGRLEALHWLVSGASGSGKSFFTGLILKRLLDENTPMSVLFVDHNRSFKRFVRARGAGAYLEPGSQDSLAAACRELRSRWNEAGSISGIELSDLDLADQKAGAHRLLSEVEAFLRSRTSTHPFYLVLDECWNLMRDNPVVVQRAFREYRKLNGAVVAITQSLSDFLTDESGQSIFQNAPIRVLLRQGEDVSRYQGILSLNAVELARVSRLKQVKGEYSECLIKTPFLSRLGRLCPTIEEHELFRTDNLRAERVAEAKGLSQRKEKSCGAVASH